MITAHCDHCFCRSKTVTADGEDKGRDELQERANEIAKSDRADDVNRGYSDEPGFLSSCPGHLLQTQTTYCDGSCQL